MQWKPIEGHPRKGRVIAASTYIESKSRKIKEIASAEWINGWLYKVDGEPFYDADVWCEYVEPVK